MSESEKTTPTPRLSGFLRKFIASPLRFAAMAVLMSLFSTVFVGRVTNAIIGKPTYKVWVVGDFTNSGKHRAIRDGFDPDRGSRTKIDDCDIEFHVWDDKGDLSRAGGISQDLAGRNDTLLVVGHMRSTNTKEALKAYLHADPPIPVILTTETNPDLAPPRQAAGERHPLIRLSATDKAQARDAAKFALDKAESFWVVEDTSNPVYSHGLALEFIRNVQESEKKGRVLLWSTTLTTPSVDTIREMKPQCIFFAGLWSNALILIRQVNAMNLQNGRRFFILSDASVEQDLIRYGGNEELANVYLMHPMRASELPRPDEAYTCYGQAARKLVDQLINEVADGFEDSRRRDHLPGHILKRAIGIHRVGDGREVLQKVIMDYPRLEKPIDGTDDFTYRPELGLSETNKTFKVWKVAGGRFADGP